MVANFSYVYRVCIALRKVAPNIYIFFYVYIMSDCFLIIAIPLANIKKAEKCQYDKIFVKLTFFKRPAPTLDELFKKKKIIHVSSNTLIHKKNIARGPVSKILKVRPTLLHILGF